MGEDLASSTVDARDERAAHAHLERAAGEHLERGHADQVTAQSLGKGDRRGDPHPQTREEPRTPIDHDPLHVTGSQLDLFE